MHRRINCRCVACAARSSASAFCRTGVSYPTKCWVEPFLQTYPVFSGSICRPTNSTRMRSSSKSNWRNLSACIVDTARSSKRTKKVIVNLWDADQIDRGIMPQGPIKLDSRLVAATYSPSLTMILPNSPRQPSGAKSPIQTNTLSTSVSSAHRAITSRLAIRTQP